MDTTPAPLDLDQIQACLNQHHHSVDHLHMTATRLLDELATERRQGAAMASITGEAIRQLAEERDAAREELAKVSAELKRLRAVPGVAVLDAPLCPCRPNAANLHLKDCPVWVNIGPNLAQRQYVRRDALANPATTAEPADEPKATMPCHCPNGRRVPYCLVHGEKPTGNCGAWMRTVIHPAGHPTTFVCTAHEGRRHVNLLTGFSWLDPEPAAG